MSDVIAHSSIPNIAWVQTASGSPAAPPASEALFPAGSECTSLDGTKWVCTVAGRPGTWVQVGSALTGSTTITSSSANAFDVGPNGATNPSFQVDASASNAATGIKITAMPAGSGMVIGAISSNTSESIATRAKGTGSTLLQSGAAHNIVQLDSNDNVILGDQIQAATTDTNGFVYIKNTAGAPTGVPAATPTGMTAMRYDTTNHKLWVYDGGWKGVVLS